MELFDLPQDVCFALSQGQTPWTIDCLPSFDSFCVELATISGHPRRQPGSASATQPSQVEIKVPSILFHILSAFFLLS